VVLLVPSTERIEPHLLGGHSNINITHSTYSHLLEGVGRQAAEAAMGLVPRNPKSTRGDNIGKTSTTETKTGHLLRYGESASH
jgi:hypothetical protein